MGYASGVNCRASRLVRRQRMKMVRSVLALAALLAMSGVASANKYVDTIELFKKAALQGNAEAQTLLGAMYCVQGSSASFPTGTDGADCGCEPRVPSS